jgi:phosphoglycerol transferase MdoB-like AlkP superfamily enzyme
MTERYHRFCARNPLDPYEKSVTHRRILLALTALAVVAAGICLGCLSLYFGALYLVWPRFFSYFSDPMLAFLNIAPVVLLLLFLWVLTDRPWLAFLLTAVVVVGLTYANFYKVVYRDDPLVAEDISSAFEALKMVEGGGYSIHLGRKFLLGIWMCLGGTAALLLFARGRIGRLRVRAAISLAPLAALIGAYFLWYPSDTRYNSFENYSLFNRWEPSEAYASRGFIYPFLHSVKDCFPDKPDGYSNGKATALLSEYDDGEIAADQQVNFVCIMLESFSDFSGFDTINFTQDPYTALHELMEESYSGTLISDTMGGGTVNAERSFLTGTTYPHPSYRSSSWSYVDWFRDQGYTTEGCHPGYAWYYNRENIDENFGFDQYYFKEDYFDVLTDREYAYDDVFLPAVHDLYEQGTADGTPYFSFSVSYQNHGKYADDELTWGEEYVSRDGLTDAAYYTVNNYFGGVADTCERLLDFIDSFRDDEAPVVIVLFGDHKPTLCDGNSAYEELGIDLTRSTVDGFTNYYATPYLIWANDAAKAVTGGDFTGDAPTIGPYFLMNEVFDQCGYTGPALTQISRALESQVQVLHSTGKYLADGELLGTLPADAAEAEQRFAYAQFYLRKKYK